jgi:hypothetical protein
VRLVKLIVLMALITASCGGGDDAGDPTSSIDATVDGCPALLTWREAQQGYLDRLAEVSIEDYEAPSDEVLNLGLTLGNVLLEAVREATQAGCGEDLFVGSETLCLQVEALLASGPAAESHLANLERDCAG